MPQWLELLKGEAKLFLLCCIALALAGFAVWAAISLAEALG